jgi:post-segregation antitoxin (ccd killing protein)
MNRKDQRTAIKRSERALSEASKNARREQWKIDNREAIAAHNDFVAEHGLFSDALRSF